ncbi:hypothetical protein BHYA_0133g00250 [Botrytis hyacinthi]|uniref:2EXR domain-containing protein n=1 Tax=Botrytis hyacinthi TaxID=278943 RepID=A0A4Z1GRA3_9HELO|nr:hypothetical protein BHYA_0133g00250 [Botrytis hyacinthi]
MSELEATSTSFMQIPEMRLAIWEALVPPPRRIYMQKSGLSLSDERYWVAKVNSDSGSLTIPNPSILRICAESRDYFIREKGYTILSCCLINPIYVNYSRDQLWFDSLSRLWSYARNVSYRSRLARRNGQMNEEVLELARIRRLGISLTGKDRIGQFSGRIMIHIIMRLPELEEVIFELPKDRFDDYKANIHGKLSGYEEKMWADKIFDPRAPPKLIYIMQEVVAPAEGLYEKVGKLETAEKSKAIDLKRIDDDHIEAFTLFASVVLELRVTMCELAVTAVTAALPELIDSFPLEPDTQTIV